MKFNQKITLFLSLLVLWSFVALAFLYSPKSTDKETVVEPPTARAEFFSRENVQQRSEYIHQMLANPLTDEIPVNIREMESEFVQELKLKANQNRLKMSAAGANSQKAPSLLTWNSLGPNNVGGRTRAVAIDVTNENIILAAGVSGGVWRSTNGGQSWTKTTKPVELHSVTCIVQDTRPGKGNVWYYGTGELVGNSTRSPGAPFRGDGIYKSTDGGLTWQPLPSTQVNNPEKFNSPFMYVWDITLNPNSDNDEIIAAIYGGVVRSADGGQTWATVLGNSLYEVGNNVDLNNVPAIFYTEVYRANNGVFYATLSRSTNTANAFSQLAGIYKSDDGLNWTRFIVHTGLPYRRTEVGASLSNPNIVYFLSDTGQGHKLIKYNNATSAIEDRSVNLPDGTNEEIESFDSQSSYDLFVRVHPADENTVFVGGTNIYRSTDGFATKGNVKWIGGYNPEVEGNSSYPNHHPDQHDLIFLPSNPNVMISANDGGIFKTSNNLASPVVYEPLNNGYITTQYYTINMSQSPADNFAFGGLQDNGSILSTIGSNNNGVSLIGGDGGFAASTRFGINYYTSFQNGQVYRLTLNRNFTLSSFARVDPSGAGADPSQPILFINPYVLDHNNGNRMFFAGGDFLWRNRNLSQIPSGEQTKTDVNWEKLERTEIASGSISALETSSDQENILYYGTSVGQVFRMDFAHSDDYTVTEITSDVFPFGAYVNSIAVNPTNVDEIMVVFSNYQVKSVFRSVDGGTTFEGISGNLEEGSSGFGGGPSVRWAEIVPKTDGFTEYYLATSVGLFSAAAINGESTIWLQEGGQSIGNVPVNMLDYRRSDGKIVVATHGNGLYESQITGVVPEPVTQRGTGLVVENAFPNPFTDNIAINYTLPETDVVRARVYNSDGKLVKTIALGLGFQGENEIFWDGTDVKNSPIPPGIYIVRIEYRGEIKVQKIIYTRE
ncbi:FlgD immunoglobulin-like domain containing protein [Roseivirga sp.]|uniref:FlgD immunoglobulin-like domain containing protein n=1 Tax=Roseivirga sp. TaxID=1964215 RepID=UPI002B2725F1|nr:FlgD immunoglobulin-like domain containing protein [Roseivirga sp.]